jgi:hypothetical protein
MRAPKTPQWDDEAVREPDESIHRVSGVGEGAGPPAVPDSLLQQLHALGALRAPDEAAE